MDFINGFLTIQSLLAFLFGLVPGSIGAYKLVRFVVRKEARLYENLQRKVYLIRASDGVTLQREHELLRKNGFFATHDTIFDFEQDNGVLETIDRKAVMVVAYSASLRSYDTIIKRATRDQIPLIVVAQPGEITQTHLDEFRIYPYFEMCNTSARLLTTIFSLSAVSNL